MLIDINAYTGHWPFRQLQHTTCGARLQFMQKSGIDISMVSNLNGIFYKNTQSANEELYEALKRDRRFAGRIIPFAVINPIYAGWKDDLKKCTAGMGMKGVRLHPRYHRYTLTHPNCIELVKRTRDLGLPIALSLRMVDRRVSSWLDISEEWSLKDVLPVIREVPDAKYVILNAVNSMQLTNEETNLLKGSDFLMDTSGRALTDLGNMIRSYGKEKFAYGSHSPILDHVTGLLRIESLRTEEAGEITKTLLRYKNAQAFFNL